MREALPFYLKLEKDGLRANFEELLILGERFLMLRVKVEWAKEGDSNTSFLHKKMQMGDENRTLLTKRSWRREALSTITKQLNKNCQDFTRTFIQPTGTEIVWLNHSIA